MSAGMIQGGLKKLASIRVRNSGLCLTGAGSADDHAGGEDGVVGVEQRQALVGDVHPDAVGGQGAGQPALAFEVDLDGADAAGGVGAAGGGAGAAAPQRLAEGGVGWGVRCQGFERGGGVGAGDDGVEGGRGVDAFGRQGFAVLAAVGGHGAGRERVGIGQEGVGEQQFAAQRREGGAALQQAGVEELGVQAVFVGAQDDVHHGVGLVGAGPTTPSW